MYLSMWILKDVLKEYSMETHIRSGKMCIRNVSLLYQKSNISPHTVYLCQAREFIPTLGEGIICINQNDYLIIHCTEMEEVFNKVQMSIDTYLEWDLQVRDLIEEKCSLQAVTDAALPIFQSMICVVNSGYIIEAVSGVNFLSDTQAAYRKYMQIGSGMPLNHAIRYAEDMKKQQHRKEPYVYQEPLLKTYTFAQNIFIDGNFTGSVMINLDSDKIDQSRAQLFLVLSGQVSRWHRENGPESRMMGQTAIFTKLLERNTDIDKAELWYYFNRLGWYEKDEKYLIQMKDTDRNDFIYARLIHQIPQIFSNCYILRYADSILLILNTAHVPLDKVLEQLRHILKESHISLGISYPFRDLEELPQSLQQAGIALHYGIQNRQTVNYCEEFMLDYVKSVFHQQTSYDLVHPALRQMEQYDQQHHTQYFLTLKAYLTEERSLARTAAVLQIHKNTLLYRIKKIEENFHLNLDDKNQRLQILISYYILMT